MLRSQGESPGEEDPVFEKSPAHMQDLVDSVKENSRQMAGVVRHKITQDFEPLSLPADVKSDPVLSIPPLVFPFPPSFPGQSPMPIPSR